MACDPVKCLPSDVLHKIFSKLSLRDLGKASIVSKEWKAICISMPFFNITYEEFLALTPEEFKAYASSSTTSSTQEGKDDAERLWYKVFKRLEETERAHWEKHGREWTSGVKCVSMSLIMIWFELIFLKWKDVSKSQQGQKQLDLLSLCKEREAGIEFLVSLSKKSYPKTTYDWELLFQHAKAVREMTILHPLRSGFVLDIEKAAWLYFSYHSLTYDFDREGDSPSLLSYDFFSSQA